EKMQKIRGKKIALIFQEPMTALNPLHKIKRQIGEVMQIHFKKANQKRIYELMDLVGLTQDKKRILNSFPHQLSGGQRQRVMIAMALAGEPDLLIADEPTTALDVVLQKQVLDLMKELQAKLGLSILFISHDKKTVSYMADKVYQMERGRIQPFIQTKDNKLICKIQENENNVVLNAEGLNVFYNKFEALKKIDFKLYQGQTLGVVGESGSGKTTLANALLRLIDAKGKIELSGKNIAPLSNKEFNRLRKDIQIVFQDPFSSLNPRMTIGQIIAEGLYVHYPKIDKEAAVKKALRQVGLNDDYINRYPHELSGGQRQRIAIARALILNPKILILDEPTSALDAKNRNLILDLLIQVQKETKVAYLLITHDMNVISQMTDSVVVLKQGNVIETGKSADILQNPKQEYTKDLINASFLT
ncbi:MAG: ATP-binding cassette domain-containing protein, partial [Alphaproteobacteria bacterium]